MRRFFSNALFSFAFVAGFAAAGSWAYFVWGFDWGHFGSRSWGLGLMAITTGSMFAFLIAFFAVLAVQTLLFPEET